MVIEGMLALTGQHFIIDYNERVGTLPGFVEGFTNVARDEHRHVAFGARFLRDMAREGRALQAGHRAHPRRDRARRPGRAAPAVERRAEENVEMQRRIGRARRASSPMQALQRRLKVIGLA